MVFYSYFWVNQFESLRNRMKGAESWKQSRSAQRHAPSSALPRTSTVCCQLDIWRDIVAGDAIMCRKSHSISTSKLTHTEDSLMSRYHMQDSLRNIRTGKSDTLMANDKQTQPSGPRPKFTLGCVGRAFAPFFCILA